MFDHYHNLCFIPDLLFGPLSQTCISTKGRIHLQIIYIYLHEGIPATCFLKNINPQAVVIPIDTDSLLLAFTDDKKQAYIRTVILVILFG